MIMITGMGVSVVGSVSMISGGLKRVAEGVIVGEGVMVGVSVIGVGVTVVGIGTEVLAGTEVRVIVADLTGVFVRVGVFVLVAVAVAVLDAVGVGVATPIPAETTSEYSIFWLVSTISSR